MKAIEEQCRLEAEEAVNTLKEIMGDPAEPAAARLAAAKEILDRGFGKSVDRLAIAQLNGQATGDEVETLTDAELLRIAAGSGSGVIDGGVAGDVVRLHSVKPDDDC